MPPEYNQVVILSNNNAKFVFVNFKMDNDIDNLKLNDLSLKEESFMMNC
jgi:hypothetical protein